MSRIKEIKQKRKCNSVRISPSESLVRLSKSKNLEQYSNLKDPYIFDMLVKRNLDIALSVILIIFLSPLFLFCIVAVKLFTSGPLFYTDKRIGYKGNEFNFYKFRTLSENADGYRLTRLGKFLAETSLDELPQLFLVLKGDMSLIGPRPCRKEEYNKLKKIYKHTKTIMRPGISGLWQISGRNLIKNVDEQLKLDYTYVKKWSFWLDINIFFKTIAAVISGIGAL